MKKHIPNEHVISKIKKCPHCGGNWGFYQKESYKGTCNFESPFYSDVPKHEQVPTEGMAIDNGDIHDEAVYKLTSKYAYCVECKKKIALLDVNRRDLGWL